MEQNAPARGWLQSFDPRGASRGLVGRLPWQLRPDRQMLLVDSAMKFVRVIWSRFEIAAGTPPFALPILVRLSMPSLLRSAALNCSAHVAASAANAPGVDTNDAMARHDTARIICNS